MGLTRDQHESLIASIKATSESGATNSTEHDNFDYFYLGEEVGASLTERDRRTMSEEEFLGKPLSDLVDVEATIRLLDADLIKRLHDPNSNSRKNFELGIHSTLWQRWVVVE